MNYINTEILTQHSEADIRAANPNTSFGNPFVPPQAYALVFPAPQPTYNPVTQHVQAAPPAQTSKGHYEQQWIVSSLFATPAEEEAAVAADVATKRRAAVLQIDADTDSIYGSVLGNRAEEYTSAGNDAASFKSAGYTGTVPAGVKSWATAKGWTATQAADDILKTAASWLAAQNGIRAARLLRKEQVKTATNVAGVAEALTAWQVFVTYIKKMLGLVS